MTWQVDRDQWRQWIENDHAAKEGEVGELDVMDGQLRRSLVGGGGPTVQAASRPPAEDDREVRTVSGEIKIDLYPVTTPPPANPPAGPSITLAPSLAASAHSFPAAARAPTPVDGARPVVTRAPPRDPGAPDIAVASDNAAAPSSRESPPAKPADPTAATDKPAASDSGSNLTSASASGRFVAPRLPSEGRPSGAQTDGPGDPGTSPPLTQAAASGSFEVATEQRNEGTAPGAAVPTVVLSTVASEEIEIVSMVDLPPAPPPASEGGSAASGVRAKAGPPPPPPSDESAAGLSRAAVQAGPSAAERPKAPLPPVPRAGGTPSPVVLDAEDSGTRAQPVLGATPLSKPPPLPPSAHAAPASATERAQSPNPAESDSAAGEAAAGGPATKTVLGIGGAAFFIPTLTKRREVVVEGESLEDADELDAEDLVEATDAAPPALPGEREQPATAQRLSPPPVERKLRRQWFDEVFGDHYPALARANPEVWATRDAQFIAECTELPAGATILDVGAGDGSHCYALADLGYRVTGLDASLAQLFVASQLNGNRENPITLLHGDMRDPPIDEQFDAVLCLGTSFGYFEDDHNRKALEAMHRRVRAGGRLVLQVFNRDHVVSRLPARSWWAGSRCLVLDEAEMNFRANRLRVHRTIVFEDGRNFEHFIFIRAYTLHDLGRLLTEAGFKVLEVSGSRETRGHFFGATSPDIWIVAEPVVG